MKTHEIWVYTNYIPYCLTVMDVSIQGLGEKYKQRLTRIKNDFKLEKEQYQPGSRHTTSFQRRYDVARCRTTSYRR